MKFARIVSFVALGLALVVGLPSVALAADSTTDTVAAIIDTATPASSNLGTPVSFAGHGVDASHSINAYMWTSSRDGQISTATAFSTSALTAGQHTISYKVVCSGGASSTVTTQVAVIGRGTINFSDSPKFVAAGSLFRVGGSMPLGHAVATSVYVKTYWQLKGHYKYRGQVKIDYPANMGSFETSMALNGVGKWKLFLYHKDYNHLLTESGNRYVTVTPAAKPKSVVVFTSAPKFVSADESFTVNGTVPSHAQTTTVYVKTYWQLKGHYRYRGQVKVDVPTGTTDLSSAMQLAGKGKWKLFLYHKDYDHNLNESGNRYVTVH